MNAIRAKYVLAVSICLWALLSPASSAFGQAVPGRNTQKAAMQKWHASHTNSFETVWPRSLAFDGDHIWIASYLGNTVMKLRANDGALLGTYAAGERPTALAFDGATVWVANEGGTVSRLRATDGANLGVFRAGAKPAAILFDGFNIWVANQDDRTVTKLRAGDGVHLGTFRMRGDPVALAFDGAHVWVAAGSFVQKLRAGDAAEMLYLTVPQLARALVFDGTHIWIAHQLYGGISKVRAAEGVVVANLIVGQDYSPNPTPISPYAVALAFDGDLIWAAIYDDENVGFVRALRPDGAIVGTFNVAEGPVSLAFDGVHIWVADAWSDRVNKL